MEIVRAQMSRIGKFDGAVESFTRMNLQTSEDNINLTNRVIDL